MEDMSDITDICVCCGELMQPCSRCGKGLFCHSCNFNKQYPNDDKTLCFDCWREEDEVARDTIATDNAARAAFYSFNR